MTKQTLKIPAHVAIIMDGNGRWAKKRFMPRVAGHKKGVETIKSISIRANELGVKLLTVYAFSTENWGRPSDEVSFLMKLPSLFFKSFLPQLIESNVRVDFIGDATALPEETQKIFHFGFAPNKREGLLAHAIRKGFSPRQLVQAGLAVEKEHGGIADKFRDRLMIPIQNISGTVIAEVSSK